MPICHLITLFLLLFLQLISIKESSQPGNRTSVEVGDGKNEYWGKTYVLKIWY